MKNLQKYPKYKDSGVEWIGEIPEHWEVRKLKYLGSMFAGLTDKKGDDFSKEYSEDKEPFISFVNVCNNLKIDENNVQYVKIRSYEIQNKIKRNDIIFLMSSETLEDIGKCSIYVGLNEKYYLNSFCKGYRIEKIDIHAEFLNYFLQSKSIRDYFSIVGRGFTRINIKQEYIKDLISVIPPLDEQEKIVNYIDTKTAQIDKAISQKEKLIELLKERKQILINDTVTKGLDKDAKHKNSGVEWIGEIREHWEVKKLKYLGSAIIGLTYSPNDLCDKNEGTLILRSSNLQEGKLTFDSNVYVKAKIPTKLKIQENDIVICSRNGSKDLIGKCAIATKKDENYSFGAFMTVFRSNLNTYLFKILNSQIFKAQSGKFSTSTINQLTISSLNSFKLPIPPKQEQEQIVNFLDKKTAQIDKAINLQKDYISKLKEYKTTLIDSLVTGKVRA